MRFGHFDDANREYVMMTILLLHHHDSAVWRTQRAGLRRYGNVRGWTFADWCVPPDADRRALAARIRALRPDGIVSSLGWKLPDALCRRIPLVCFDCPPEAVPATSAHLVHDAEKTAHLAVCELLPLGCAAYAYAGAPGGRYWSRERGEAFRREVVAQGGALVPSFELADAGVSDVAALRRWVRALPRPCGVFAANDEAALRVMAVARQEGLRVPQDLAVVGVDDSARCVNAEPTLTSVAPDWEAGAFLAAEALDLSLKGKPTEGRRAFRPLGLVSRGSTRRTSWGAGENRVREAVAFIRENACAGISVPDVVRVMGGSRRSAEMAFRAVTGRSALEEIRRVRFEQARLLVRSGVTGEAAVANRCGYASLPSFSRMFKDAHGMSFRAWVRKESL